MHRKQLRGVAPQLSIRQKKQESSLVHLNQAFISFGSPASTENKMESFSKYIISKLFFSSMQKGLNLGFVNQIPLQDVATFCPPQDINQAADGHLLVNKHRAL